MADSELVVANFDYAILSKEDAGKLRYCAGEIQKQKKSVAVSLMTIGQVLMTAHEQLAKHRSGTFQKWVESECGFSKSTAYNYMQAFSVFGNCPTVGQLEDGAMYALASNGTPEKALKEVLKLADKGTKITQKLAKTIIKKHQGQDDSGGVAFKPPKPPKPPKPVDPQLTKGELMNLDRKKAKSYAEYLVRSIDDMQRNVRSPMHPTLIGLCDQIVKGLEKW